MIAIVLGCLLLGSTVHAQVTLPVTKCLSGKLKAVSKAVQARAKCYAVAAKTAVADPTCLQKASDTLTGGADPTKASFNKLEAKYKITGPVPCLTYGDVAAVDSQIAAYAATLPIDVGAALGKCDAAKTTCVGKYVGAIAKCDAQAASKTGTVDSACLAKAATKLAGSGGCLDKAALTASCTHAGSQVAVLQGAADRFVQASVCALDPGNAGCITPTPIPSSTASNTPTPTEPSTHTPTSTDTQTPTPTATSVPTASQVCSPYLGDFYIHHVPGCPYCGDTPLAVLSCSDAAGECVCISQTAHFAAYFADFPMMLDLYNSRFEAFDPLKPDGSYVMVSLYEFAAIYGWVLDPDQPELECFGPAPACPIDTPTPTNTPG